MATSTARPAEHRRGRLDRAGQAVTGLPPASFFTVSAVFHYLGPSLAFLLFAHVSVLGVAWLRIASAAVLLALWRRPWRRWRRAARRERQVLLALGVVLAAMNSLFYLAVARLPLSTVGAIEFLGTVLLAAAGARSRRNLLALTLLGQVPTPQDLLGVGLVVVGVAVHQPAPPPSP